MGFVYEMVRCPNRDYFAAIVRRFLLVLSILATGTRACASDDESQPGLLAFWSSNVSHATKLGEVDWSKYTNLTVETRVNWANSNSAFYVGGPTDYFALKLVGNIAIPATGSWTLGVGSDAGARLFIDGRMIVNDDADHGFRRTAATIALSAGTHSIEIRYLEIYYSQGLVLDWQGPGVASVTVVPDSAFTHLPSSVATVEAGHGLRAYWSSGMSHATRLGEVDWAQYDTTTIEQNVSWPITNSAFYSGGPTDYFSLRLKGTITISEAGTWQFKLGSDAGARLFIDGQLIVNDDSDHSFRFTSGSTALTAGTHDIEVRYLEIYYSQGLVLTWKAPSASYEEVIPSSAFAPAAVEAAVGTGGNGLNAYWSNAVSHATTLGQVDWMTYNTATTVSNVSWKITNNAFYPGGPADYFAVRLMGQITIPTGGSWTFKLGSDAGARLIIDGNTIVNDDADHSFRFTSGTVSLSPGVHDFEVRYLEIYYSQGLVATWKAPGAAYEEVIPASAFSPLAYVPPASGSGLRAYWTSGTSHATKLGEIDWSTYDQTTMVSSVNWGITNSAFYTGGPTDYFAVRLVGLLHVPQAGTWTFKLGSDAGARLFVNGTMVVNDNADHSFRFTSGSINLPAGDVRIEIRYLEIYYSQGLVLTWQGPGVAYEEVIPSTAFAPDPGEPPADTAGGGLRAYWSSGTSHATKLGQVDWATYDTTTVVPKVNWRITNNPFYTNGPTDYFALRLVGLLHVPAAGSWTFKLGSDAGARLFVNGQLVVNDDSDHSFRFASGSIALPAGDVRIEIRYLEIYYSQGLFLTWQGPGVSNEEVVPASAFALDPQEPLADAGGGGLRAYWTGGTSHATKLGQVDWAAYDTTSVVPKINWRITNNAFYTNGPTDYFAARFVAAIDIPTDGVWQFGLGSDAGAELLIDGQSVIRDDSDHSFRFASGSVKLAAGTHTFEVRYLEIYYSQGLFVTWRAPGAAYEEVIPSSALTPAALESPGGTAAGTGGLTAAWVKGSYSNVNNVNWTSLTYTSHVDNINWRITNNPFYLGGPTDYFAVKLTGIIHVSEAGVWKFNVGSDAGARLLIDGVEVVNDGADHSFRFTPGTINLATGNHQFELQYLEVYYSQGLVATWRAPSELYESVIPATAFVKNAVRVFRWSEVTSDD